MPNAINKPPETLSNLLTTLLRNLGIEKKVKEHEAIIKWPAIVGSQISEVTTPEKAVNGILFVKVRSSAWKSELIFLKMDILSKIDKTVGSGIIKDIRFI